jgi:hypothetical protein
MWEVDKNGGENTPNSGFMAINSPSNQIPQKISALAGVMQNFLSLSQTAPPSHQNPIQISHLPAF